MLHLIPICLWHDRHKAAESQAPGTILESKVCCVTHFLEVCYLLPWQNVPFPNIFVTSD